MAAGSSILVVTEISGSEPTALSLEMLGLARQLTGGAQTVGAVILGEHPEDAPAQLIARGADKVYFDKAARYEPDVWVGALAALVRDGSFGLVLFGHTNQGSDLAPRLAFRLSGAVATNCEGVKIEAGEVLATRVSYGGKARSVMKLRGAAAILTMRTNAHAPLEADASRTGEVLPIRCDVDVARSRLLDRTEDNASGPRLENAKIVIGGGRGLGGPEGFQILEEIARKLGGVVGASRVACDLGWCPPSLQIGLTGKTIAPDLYIAVGISGASQHMAGCAGAKTIVAINTDPDAPIFEDASIGIVGDYKELLPKIAEELARLNS